MKKREELITISKFQKNVMRAEAIEELANALNYKFEDYKNSISSYLDQLSEMEENNEVLTEYGDVSWRYENAYRSLQKEYEKKEVVMKLFDTLDKMLSK